jgi:hypothetical protein
MRVELDELEPSNASRRVHSSRFAYFGVLRLSRFHNNRLSWTIHSVQFICSYIQLLVFGCRFNHSEESLKHFPGVSEELLWPPQIAAICVVYACSRSRWCYRHLLGNLKRAFGGNSLFVRFAWHRNSCPRHRPEQNPRAQIEETKSLFIEHPMRLWSDRRLSWQSNSWSWPPLDSICGHCSAAPSPTRRGTALSQPNICRFPLYPSPLWVFRIIRFASFHHLISEVITFDSISFSSQRKQSRLKRWWSTQIIFDSNLVQNDRYAENLKVI